MKKLQNFKLFESGTEKLPIYDVEDYIVEVLDKYKDRILRWAIGEYLADPTHGDLYDTEHYIDNGQYRKRKVSESAPEGSFIAYDILIEIKNDTEDTPLGWEGFCDFDTFNSLINDLKKSLHRLNAKHFYLQIGHGFDKHTITLLLVTNEVKK